MGTELPYEKNDDNEKYYLICVDIDDKNDIDKLNGLKKWAEVLKHNDINDITNINTPIEKNINKGYHYLFKINETQLNFINSNIIALKIENIKYSIDILIKNSLIVSPTKYNNKCYEWLKHPNKYYIQKLPEFIYKLIVQHKINDQPTKNNTNKNNK
jgi:hypothetical protein